MLPYESTIAHRLTNGEKEYLSYDFATLPNPFDIKIAEKNLLSVKKILDDLAIPFWLQFGTCLGAVRDGALIPHDRDVDLGLYKDIVEQEIFYDALLAFQDIGFEIIRTAYKDDLITILRDKVYIDFYSITKVNYNSTWTWGPCIEEDYYSKLADISFLDTTFQTPSPVLEWLEARYGKTWRTVIKGQRATVLRDKNYE